MKEHGHSGEVENKFCESAERDSDIFVCYSDYFTFLLFILFQHAMELEGKIKFHELL